MATFYVLATKFKGSTEPIISKISFDRKDYKDIPAKYHHPVHHPLVTRHNIYKSFLQAIAKTKNPIETKCYRNVPLAIDKNGDRTEEANTYLDNNNEFFFKGHLLETEQSAAEKTVDKSKELDPGNFSALELMEVFGRLCAGEFDR